MLAVVVALAFIAGLGWGALYVVVYLRPERVALRQERHTREVIGQIQAGYDQAVRQIARAQPQRFEFAGPRHRMPADMPRASRRPA